MTVYIDNEFDGRTVLQLLSAYGFSRKSVSRLKRLEHGIELNGAHVTVRAVLHTGDFLYLETSDTEDDTADIAVPAPLPLDIIYEDEYIVVPNKPAGMPTHPSHGHYNDSLANALSYIYRDSPFVFRPINRLDRDTSGAVLVAKDKRTASLLAAQMEKHGITKKYIAVVNGAPQPEEGVIKTYIRRTADSIITREAVTEELPGSKEAVTVYKTLCRGNGMSALLCEPVTGRTHQLRVHFAFKGCPIVGDTLYGSASGSISRQALHAVSLSFVHPCTNEELTLRAPLHEDMKKLLKENFPECYKDDLI